MKKYHLADALTVFEIIMAIILIGMAIYQVPADIGIWIFVLGELADAFDGPCARRWPYPDDGKYRWWRQPRTVKRLEHFSDIFIACACMLYLIRLPATFDLFAFKAVSVSNRALMLGLFIIAYCLIAEIIIRLFRRQHTEGFDTVANWFILIRRLVYAVLGVGGGVFLLIMATGWDQTTKLRFILAGFLAAAFLLYYKSDRATDPS